MVGFVFIALLLLAFAFWLFRYFQKKVFALEPKFTDEDFEAEFDDITIIE